MLVAIVLLEHLLKSEQAYDARVQHEFKKLGMIILVHEMATLSLTLRMRVATQSSKNLV